MVVGFGIFAFIPFLSYGAMIKFLNAHDIYNEAILDEKLTEVLSIMLRNNPQ